jgi:hypothetical protein
MIVRPYLKTDEDAVKALHAIQNLPYELPDWEKPEFLVRAVLENGTGRPEMFLALRKTAETYLLFDPKQVSTRATIGRILALTKECQPAAKRAGLTDLHAWIHPDIDAVFGRLLDPGEERGKTKLDLGWNREPLWPCYVKAVSL